MKTTDLLKNIEDPTYVQPTSDIGFHWVFCREGNEELVLQLLNACIDDKEIVSFTRLNTEHTVNADTVFRFDLYCECSDGSRVIVECQNWTKRENFIKRAMVYSSLAITDQLKPNLDYNIQKVYFIGLLNYNQFPGRQQAITKVGLYTEDDHKLVNDGYLQIFVELRKLPDETDDNFSTLFLRAIRDIGKGKNTELRYTDERLDRLKRAAWFNTMPKNVQEAYKENMSTEDDIRMYWEEQVSDARIEGEARGRAEGIAEGEARGEAKAQMEIARKMKALSLSDEQIAAATSLSIEEIREL